ncbi:MAG: GNAT family N-acetyltransferase [Roseburia sp.]
MEGNAELSLRKAMLEDIDFLYELRNDDEVRKNSFHTERIAYEKHMSWFRGKLRDADAQIFILMLGDKRVGQIRLDAAGNGREISYALCREARGSGYSKWMLGDVENKIRQHHLGDEAHIVLIGEVKRENIASRKVFRSLGYQEEETGFGFQYQKILQ